MPKFIMMTQLSPDRAEPLASMYVDLADQIHERIASECPEVRWLDRYGVLGRYDTLEVFEAPDEAAAMKVAIALRSIGQVTAEIMPALSWDRFRQLAAELDRGVKRPETRPRDRGRTEEPREAREVDEVDYVRLASEDSFPASDPPAWTGTSVS